jgi:creatinine amidohydrolase
VATTNSVPLSTVCRLAACALALAASAGPAAAASVQLEDLNWTELRDRIAAGATTVLLPIGGTEQNGPHMVLGKHNQRVRLLATRIADKLGNAIVAPVLAYVPEGEPRPPTQHMRWPGTISIPAPVFEGLLEGATRSLRQHGFCHVVLLGDHGGYRSSLDRVAAKLNRDASGNCKVHPLPEFYRAATADFNQTLASRGYTKAEIGTHAGLADTALALAVDPALVRAGVKGGQPGDGVAGDPTRATAELGRPGLEHIIDITAAAVRAATQSKP